MNNASGANGEASLLHGKQALIVASSLGAKIASLRKIRGYSLEDIANHLGVSKPSVWAWEHNKANPRPERITEIAAFLGVDVEELHEAGDAMGNMPNVIRQCKEVIAKAYGVSPEQVTITVTM